MRHQLATGFTRPFDLYTALLEAASALSAFQVTGAVELPSYDHDDPMTCFQKVIDHIDLHLGEAVPTRFTEIKLEVATVGAHLCHGRAQFDAR
ncbi:MAG: type VI secretion system baseplate subunit TssK [Deltaproteobacteria bacterium]|nr:type VI secretion system baseplate subunit TssK [Deltaproteobacteria bacterium]